MRIGFDLDGVVAEIDLASLRVIDFIEDRGKREELFRFYYACRKVDLNPMDFLTDGDEAFFITGRPIMYGDVTERWVSGYFGRVPLIMTNAENPIAFESIDKWFVKQANKKAVVLKRLGIDVYFEDTPEIVVELRRLCSGITVIQYGGRQRV